VSSYNILVEGEECKWIEYSASAGKHNNLVTGGSVVWSKCQIKLCSGINIWGRRTGCWAHYSLNADFRFDGVLTGSREILRWLVRASKTFQRLNFDGSILQLYIKWCYDIGG